MRVLLHCMLCVIFSFAICPLWYIHPVITIIHLSPDKSTCLFVLCAKEYIFSLSTVYCAIWIHYFLVTIYNLSHLSCVGIGALCFPHTHFLYIHSFLYRQNDSKKIRQYQFLYSWISISYYSYELYFKFVILPNFLKNILINYWFYVKYSLTLFNYCVSF